MAQVEIRLVVDEGNASAVIQKVAADLGAVGITSQEVTPEIEQVGAAEAQAAEGAGKATGANEGLNVGLANLALGYAAVREGLAMVGEAYDATIGKTLEYAKNVEDMSRLIGASTEESSKLITAAGDLGIEYGSLQTAMDIAAKKGLDPTIEGMGKLADQYNAITDPLARTKMLLDDFGRSGAQLAPLMQLGSAGIKQLGDQATATGLVLSEDTVKKAEAARLAMANFNDAVKGLTVSLTTGLIPALTSAAETATFLIDGHNQLTAATDLENDALAKNTKSYADWLVQAQKNFDATHQGRAQMVEWINYLKDHTQAWYDNAQAAQTDTAAVQDNTGSVGDAMNAYYAHADALAADKAAQDAATQATQAAKNANDMLAAGLSGQIKQADDNYDKSLDTHKTKIAQLTEQLKKETIPAHAAYTETITKGTEAAVDYGAEQLKIQTAQDNINKLNSEIASKGDPFSLHADAIARYQQEIAGAQQKIADYNAGLTKHTETLTIAGQASDTYTAKGKQIEAEIDSEKAAIEAEAVAHHEATNKIVFDLAVQQAARVTNNADATLKLMEYGQTLGLVSGQDVEAYRKISEAAKQLATDGNVDIYIGKVKDVQQGLENIGLDDNLGKTHSRLTDLARAPEFKDIDDRAKGNRDSLDKIGTSAETMQTGVSRNLSNISVDPSWSTWRQKNSDRVTDMQGIETEAVTMAQTNSTQLLSMVSDPSWADLHQCHIDAQADAKATSDAINAMPTSHNITVTITHVDKYVTQGGPSPSTVAAASP